MSTVPTPVGGETRASCALYPTPASNGPTNHGNSHPHEEQRKQLTRGSRRRRLPLMPAARCGARC